MRWTERFAPDAEDEPGQATCEGGEHLPMIGTLAGALARIVQDFARDAVKRDAIVDLRSVTPTA